MIKRLNSSNAPESVEGLVTRLFRRMGRIVFLSLLVLSSVFAVAQYYIRLNVEHERLTSISQQASRVLAGEILAGNSAGLPPLIEQLKAEWKLGGIIVAYPGSPGCERVSAPCFEDSFELSSEPIRIVLIGNAPEFPIQWLATMVGGLTFIVALLYLFTHIVSRKLREELLTPLQILSRDPTRDDVNGVEEIRVISRNFRSFIGERDQSQAKLELLEQKARLGELASQVIHDLASPVAVLSHLQKQDIVSISTLGKAIERIEEISLDLKQKYREELGPCTFLLFDFLSDVVKEKKIQWQHLDQLKLKLVMPQDMMEIFVSGHRSDLFRVFSNLLNNAVQSAQKKFVATRQADAMKIVVEAKTDGSQLLLRVDDNGVGLTADQVQKLMHGKGRDLTVAQSGSGMGLGFNYAKRVIQAHGWELGLESAPERGARVTVRLTEAEPPAWFPTQLRKKIEDAPRILWIDDDASFLERMREVLSHHPARAKVQFHPAQEVSRLDLEHEISKQTLFWVDMNWDGQSQAGLRWVAESPVLLSHARSANLVFVTDQAHSKALQNAVSALGLQVCGKEWLEKFI